MIRLDKFLCDTGTGSRSEVKILIRQGQIQVNGKVEKDSAKKIDETKDAVSYRGSIINYNKFGYFMLNKPMGFVSATRDNVSDTVLELLEEPSFQGLFPVGRLDKDTEGLLLITNDGKLAHNLLSPKKHVDKTYMVEVEKPLTKEDVKALEEGVDIGEEKPTLPAKVEILSSKKLLLTIREGKFHQVKRMLIAVDNQVLALKRVSMGPLTLDKTLTPGQYRALTETEVEQLKGVTKEC